MASVSDWKVPSSVQPKPEDYSTRPGSGGGGRIARHHTGDAFTAETLGTERAGNGVIIRNNGLVLTIGYLITEADTIWLTLSDGRSCRGMCSAMIGIRLRVGAGARQNRDARACLRSIRRCFGRRAGGGRRRRRTASFGCRARRRQAEFAGYWEYVLDEAIFTTAPSHPNWGGTALIGPAICSASARCNCNRRSIKGRRKYQHDGSIDLLHPIFDDLINRPAQRGGASVARLLRNRSGKQARCGRARRPRPGQTRRSAHGRYSALGRRQRGPRLGEPVPPHLGTRPGRGRGADHHLSRRRNHAGAREIRRARPLPQRAEPALTRRGSDPRRRPPTKFRPERASLRGRSDSATSRRVRV